VEIFASQGAPPISTTPAANFATVTAGVVDTGSKLSQNSRIQGSSNYFCMMIEGSGSGFRVGSKSGSIPLTSGSGSGRPKTWIWIRNTDPNYEKIREKAWNEKFVPPAQAPEEAENVLAVLQMVEHVVRRLLRGEGQAAQAHSVQVPVVRRQAEPITEARIGSVLP
jgi:hypothetical protein